MPEGRTIGRAERRRDGAKMATGRATFTDDVALPGLLQARLLVSPHAHARISHLDTATARALSGVAAVLTHQDFPAGARGDSLFDPHLRYAGDRVAVVAAEDAELARHACETIDVRYDVLPFVLDPELALASGPEAMAAELRAEVGDFEAAIADAQHVLERTYRLPRAPQAGLEPHVSLAWLDEDQRLVVRTSSHVPFEVRRVLARRLNIPLRRVRVLAPRDSGGFGGRLGVFAEDLCASLALHTGRPVRLVRPREEELAGPRAGHAQTITIRSGVTDGQLIALEMTLVENAGAHDEWAASALRAAGGVLALYRCPNLRFHGRAAATNLPPAGALRGDGVCQAVFALESHIDELAGLVGADAVVFRERHHVREGDETPIWAGLAGDVSGRPRVVQSCALEEALRLGAKATGWRTSKRSGRADGPTRRGMGVALAVQSPGTIGAETTSATLDMNEDGSFLLFVGTADMDAGGDTVLCQIAAEVLAVPAESVVAHAADTDVVPYASGPTRSSALYVSGLAVRKAAEAVRLRIVEHAAHALDVDPRTLFVREGAVHSADGGRLSYEEVGRATLLGAEPRPISATLSHSTEDAPPPFAAVFAEVEVDVETGVVRVVRLVEAVDCGRILHPQIAEARIEGGALHGLEHAISAPVAFDAGGRPLGKTLRDYRLFTAADAPELVTLLIPGHEPTGPFGAKSIAEIAIHGVAPAVANAVAQAIGARVYELPLTPERVRAALAAVPKPTP